jgi:hypothetical protein
MSFAAGRLAAFQARATPLASDVGEPARFARFEAHIKVFKPAKQREWLFTGLDQSRPGISP